MSSLQAVSAQRLYRLIADQIAQKIRNGEFAPGERLPSERELAEQLSVARSTLREALIALEIGGLIEVRVGSGVFVSEPPEQGKYPTPSDGTPLATNAPSTAAEASPFALLEARTLIEPECAALAAQNASADQLGAIEEARRKMKPDLASNARNFAFDRAFHESIAAACGNAALQSVVTHIWDLCEANTLYQRLDKHFVDESAWRQAMGEHDRIVAALTARDPVRARHAMSFHLIAIRARLSEDIRQ